MKTENPIYVEYDYKDTFVDISKPFDYNTLLYKVVNDKNQPPSKENSLYLTIDNHWFTEIIQGRKNKEYREIKDTTYNRYLNLQKSKDGVLVREDAPDNTELDILAFNNGFFPFMPKPYAYLKLAVGYNKNRAWAIIEVTDISFEPAIDDDGKVLRFTYDENLSEDEMFTPDGVSTFWQTVYHLGKVVEFHAKGE